MDHPEIATIRQEFDARRVDDVAVAVAAEMDALGLSAKIAPGDTVAITAGSRGIVDIAGITRTMVEKLRDLGARPFIFASMGSHGGATDEGQLRVLERLGVTEKSMGCPVKSSMETVYLGDAAEGYPINIDRHASEADHIVVANRIKAHTKFSGPVESGLMKMMTIGMGKQEGARYYHKAAVQLTFQNIIENVGKEIINRCPILFGLGIVENAYHQTAKIKALAPRDIFDGERKLLKLSKRLMPRLPFNDIDVLVVDRIGKDVSGTGMDTNIIGRNNDILDGLASTIGIKRIFVRDLTPGTEGNALGIGYADFTTTRLVDKIDRQKTYMNCLTAISPEKGAIPMYFDTDEEALQACYETIGNTSPERIRLVRVKDTLSLSDMVVSKAFAHEVETNDSLETLSDWKPLLVGKDGNMTSPF